MADVKTTHICFNDLSERIWTQIPFNDVYKMEARDGIILVQDVHNIYRGTKEIFFLDLTQRLSEPRVIAKV